jgi:hypothetical protein
MILECNQPWLMPNSAPTQSSEPANPGYETRDANVRGVLFFVAGLMAVLIASYFVLTIWYRALERDSARIDASATEQQPASVATPQPYFPYPREQVSPSADLQAFRARENAKLNSYGWIDEKSGVVRVPIERAMDLLLKKGLPTRAGTNEADAGPSVLELQQQRPKYGATNGTDGQ